MRRLPAGGAGLSASGCVTIARIPSIRVISTVDMTVLFG